MKKFTSIEKLSNEYFYHPNEPSTVIRFIHDDKIYLIGDDPEEALSIDVVRKERGYLKPSAKLVSELRKAIKGALYDDRSEHY